MEIVRKILSVSHGGTDAIWHPLYIDFDENKFVIKCTNVHFPASNSTSRLLNLMFSTINQRTEIAHPVSSKIDWLNQNNSSTRFVQCTVLFETDQSVYKLERTLLGNFAIDSKLTKLKTNVIFRDEECINILNRMKRPILKSSINHFPNNNSNIFYKIRYNRGLKFLVSSWMKSIGFEDQDFLSKPSIKSGSKFQSIRTKINQYLGPHHTDNLRNQAIIHLFMVLAQLVIKKRDTGRAEPILFNFVADSLNDFELFSIINLVNQIQKEERVQLILFIDILDRETTNIPDMLDGFQLPDFEIYYH